MKLWAILYHHELEISNNDTVDMQYLPGYRIDSRSIVRIWSSNDADYNIVHAVYTAQSAVFTTVRCMKFRMSPDSQQWCHAYHIGCDGCFGGLLDGFGMMPTVPHRLWYCSTRGVRRAILHQHETCEWTIRRIHTSACWSTKYITTVHTLLYSVVFSILNGATQAIMFF